ncbi:MAG: anhydro-N-acetylmuramic acid kinase [Verrucomicrobiaceae bacterium]|nr:anhydro-N-acetylmuramic acid kinase [Verrucomicrobiaceae bacterium]
MSQTGELYVGLMSGTSLDGIDAVLIDLTDQPRLIAANTFAFPPELHTELLALCQPGADEIERLGRADRWLGIELGKAVNQLLAAAHVDPENVRAIGSHGQTVRHRPPISSATADHSFTLQIGDPTSIVEATNITTIADFRRRDIAAGGQGAPLVPAFHRAVFSAVNSSARAIVNIGGIANISGLAQNRHTIGFDTGPGNTLLDNWIYRHHHLSFDGNGAWAASGKIIPDLLSKLLRDPYFALPMPKSTGREYFPLDWLDRQLAGSHWPTEDVQATLLELTAQTIADGIAALPFPVAEVFICGGGAYNKQLMTRLEALLFPRTVATTAQLGIAPEWVEAAAFAWLAQQTLHGKPGNEPAATGAINYRVLGAIYPR